MKQNLLVAGVLSLLVMMFLVLMKTGNEPTIAGVNQGQEYFATSTVLGGGVLRQLRTDAPAVLGSVVVASSSATTITLRNATSSTDSASTTVLTMPADATVGTYTFDVGDLFPRGMALEVPSGFNGEYIITWR